MTDSKLVYVDPAELEPSEQHVRTEHTDPAPEFIRNVEQVGIVTPPQGRYEDGELRLIDGVRRAKAASKAGIESIPVIVRDLSDAEAIAASVTLNDRQAGVRKSVVDVDRERQLKRVAKRRGTTVEDERTRLGLWPEDERIHDALEHLSGIGPATAEALADEFGDLETVKEAPAFQLQEAEGVGERTARAIRHYFDSDDGESEVVTRV